MPSSKQDQDALSRARAAKDRLQKTLASRADVCGIGITKVGASFGLKVNLSGAEHRDSIPAAVQGVPVIVYVVGAIRKR